MSPNSFIPESIHIKNFSNITELKIDFPSITVITGKNGSGKSSVIDAFFYCLTGQTIRDVQIADIIRKGEKSAVVKIVGTYNGERVEITRTRTSSSQKLSVLVGEDKKPEPNPKELLAGIVTPGEFMNLFLIDGHNLARFSSVGSKEMSANIDKMFNIGKLDVMIAEIGQASARFDKEVKVMEAKTETLRAKKEASVQVAKLTGKDVFEARIAGASERLPPLRADAEEFAAKISSIREKIKERIVLLDSIRLDEAKRSKIADDIAGMNGKIEGLDGMILSSKQELEAGGGESAVISINEEIEALQKSIASAEAEFTVRKDFPALIKKAMEAAPGGTACPMCATPGARAAAEKNLIAIASSNKDVLSSLLTRKVKAQKEIAEKETALKKLTGLQSIVTGNERETALLARMREEKVAELNRIDGRISSIDPEKASMEKASLDGEMESASDSLSKTTAIIQTLTRDADDARRSLAEIDGATIDGWNDEKDAELAGLAAEASRVAGRIEKLAVLKSICRDTLSNIRERIMNTLTPNVMECIKNFGMGESAITKFEIVPRVKTVKKNEQVYYYDFAVEAAGSDVPFDALSTGQKALAIISIILSMINYSSCALSCLFFDEIDSSGLDRSYIQTIVKAIVKIAGSIKVVFVDRDKTAIEALVVASGKKGLQVPIIEMPDPARRE